MRAATLRPLVALLLALPGSASAQAAGSAERGEAVYAHWCAICHDRGARGFPGTQALEILHGGAVPAALADRTDLDPDYVEYVVRHGLSVMPFFRPTEVGQGDMADLKAYLTRDNP